MRKAMEIGMLRGDNAVAISHIYQPMFLMFKHLHKVTRALEPVFKPLRRGLGNRMNAGSAGGWGRA